MVASVIARSCGSEGVAFVGQFPPVTLKWLWSGVKARNVHAAAAAPLAGRRLKLPSVTTIRSLTSDLGRPGYMRVQIRPGGAPSRADSDYQVRVRVTVGIQVQVQVASAVNLNFKSVAVLDAAGPQTPGPSNGASGSVTDSELGCQSLPVTGSRLELPA
jgi:hypothetical protein